MSKLVGMWGHASSETLVAKQCSISVDHVKHPDPKSAHCWVGPHQACLLFCAYAEAYLLQAPFSCCLQYQFNNRILAAAVARRPATAYELSHAEECAASGKVVPVLYQAAA